VGPIARIARRQYLTGLAAVERGDFDALLSQFAEDCRLVFVGDTSLGADLRGRADLRRWFERFSRLLPRPSFHVEQLVISGPVWDQRLAAHVLIRSTVDGEPYQNQFAHFLTIRWGKVVDDLILEDTQTWARACQRLADAGVTEAIEPGFRQATHAGGASSTGPTR
jgi:ketosteroid isomerase-like protein